MGKKAEGNLCGDLQWRTPGLFNDPRGSIQCVLFSRTQPHWDFVLHSSLNTRLTTTLSQWAKCEVQRWNTCLASFKITWEECLHEGLFRSYWPVCVLLELYLDNLSRYGKTQYRSRWRRSLGLCLGLNNKGESELNASTLIPPLSSLDCGCDWFLQVPEALTSPLWCSIVCNCELK